MHPEVARRPQNGHRGAAASPAPAGATDIAGQTAVLPTWRDSEGTGDCPLGRASALSDGVPVPTLRHPGLDCP